MLTVKKLSLVQASTYYSKDNYYTKQQGEYHGKLKDELGLDDLTHESFNQLLNGINPNTGERLVHSKNGKEGVVPAFDFTFSPTKSISIAYELALAKGDTKLLNKLTKAHNNAVNDALSHIEETEIKARVQKNKKRVSLKTGNMIAAKFQHDINRNLDPQLHTHSVIFNFTKINGKYRALDAQDFLKKKSPIIKNLGKFYRQSLKTELEKAGFELRDTSKKDVFYEIKQIDDSLIKTFSSRRRAIEKKVKQLKKQFPQLSNAQLSMRAFFNTRVTKKEVNREEVAKKNLEIINKTTNADQLLKELNQLKPKVKKQNINHEEIFTIIKEARKELAKEKYKSLKTPLNISVEVFNKIDNKDISIKDIYEHVEVQDQLEPLITMHDVVKAQLKMTRFNLKNIKNVNQYNNKEELLENAKFKIRDIREIDEQFIEKYSRSSGATTKKFDELEREYGGIDRTAIAERYARGRTGTELERPNDDSNRIIREDSKKPKAVRITRDDLRKANQIPILQEQEQENSL